MEIQMSGNCGMLHMCKQYRSRRLTQRSRREWSCFSLSAVCVRKESLLWTWNETVLQRINIVFFFLLGRIWVIVQLHKMLSEWDSDEKANDCF